MSVSIPTSALERLAQRLIPYGKLLHAWALTGGVSAEMTALDVADSAGGKASFILRQPGTQALAANPRAAVLEFKALQLVRSLRLPAPKPILLDMSGEIFPQPYLVIEFVDGQPEFAPADPVGLAIKMEETLAAIHSANLFGQDVSFLPKTAPGLSDFRAGQRAGGDPRLEEARIRAALGESLPVQVNSSALLHGDFWPGNLLWREGRLEGVIDWEDACLGDPLADFAVSRLDILWIYGTDAYKAFSERYLTRTAIDVGNRSFWDLCAALRLARLAGADLDRWTAFFRSYGRTDITVETFLGHYHYFVEQALEGLLE